MLIKLRFLNVERTDLMHWPTTRPYGLKTLERRGSLIRRRRKALFLISKGLVIRDDYLTVTAGWLRINTMLVLGKRTKRKEVRVSQKSSQVPIFCDVLLNLTYRVL